ncbi:MAG: hypothetical protein HY553_00950 [Elusimicrobia bacterium]|nr:hypothetical protein [Elusimicrobiota bacterium]
MARLLLVLFVLAQACAGSHLRARLRRDAPPPDDRWERRGYWTEEDLETDRESCRRQVRRQTVDHDEMYGMQPGSIEDSRRRHRACMETLGWKLRRPLE